MTGTIWNHLEPVPDLFFGSGHVTHLFACVNTALPEFGKTRTELAPEPVPNGSGHKTRFTYCYLILVKKNCKARRLSKAMRCLKDFCSAFVSVLQYHSFI